MRRFFALACPILLACSLAGCGSQDTRQPDPKAECTAQDSETNLSECSVTLSDTRKVDCVVYSGYKQGGLSCDWAHASGTDRGE